MMAVEVDRSSGGGSERALHYVSPGDIITADTGFMRYVPGNLFIVLDMYTNIILFPVLHAIRC